MFRLWTRRACLAAIALCLAPVAQAASLPACAGPVEVARAKIVRVENNGVLVLSDGRAVDIEGLLLPRGHRDRAPGFLARRAIDAVRTLVRGRHATLAVRRPKEDRYGRLRAQVFVRDHGDKTWLQRTLLRRGLARVNIAADRRECTADLYAAERRARAAHRGIWSVAAYRVRKPDGLARDIGTFQVVEGVVVGAAIRGGRAYINFGRDWRTDFTATVAPDDMKLFRRAGFDPRALIGKRVRVRGWIQSFNGPEIQLATPEAVEILRPAAIPELRPGEMQTKRPG